MNFALFYGFLVSPIIRIIVILIIIIIIIQIMIIIIIKIIIIIIINHDNNNNNKSSGITITGVVGGVEGDGWCVGQHQQKHQ